MAAAALGTAGEFAGDELSRLAWALYQFMLDSEAASYGRLWDERLEQLRGHARELASQFERARTEAACRLAGLAHETSKNLRAMAREMDKHRPEPAELRARWAALGHNYEALFAHIRRLRLPSARQAQLGHLKPRNIARNIFHMCNGIGCVLLYMLLLDKTEVLIVAGTALFAFAALDWARRVLPSWNDGMVHRIFAKISRPRDAHRVPSSTWYLVGMFVGVLLLPKHTIALGTVVLAVGDPIASVVGKTWGRTKLGAEKTLEGSLAFLLAAGAAGVLFLTLALPHLPLQQRLAVAAGVGLTGAVTELASKRLDDNLTIPLACGAVAALML